MRSSTMPKLTRPRKLRSRHLPGRTQGGVELRRILIGVAAAFAAVLLLSVPLAGAATAGGNVLVTGGPYLSADQLAGGAELQAVLARLGDSA